MAPSYPSRPSLPDVDLRAGTWAAYTLTTIDAEKDKRGSDDDKKPGAQRWRLLRQGGEALEVSDTQWAPDSTRLAFVMSDVNPADEPE